MLWSTSPWTSACIIGADETLHVHERLCIIAMFDWRRKRVRIRPRLYAFDIALQKAHMRRAAIRRHALILAPRIPSGPLSHVFAYYA